MLEAHFKEVKRSQVLFPLAKIEFQHPGLCLGYVWAMLGYVGPCWAMLPRSTPQVSTSALVCTGMHRPHLPRVTWIIPDNARQRATARGQRVDNAWTTRREVVVFLLKRMISRFIFFLKETELPLYALSTRCPRAVSALSRVVARCPGLPK